MSTKKRDRCIFRLDIRANAKESTKNNVGPLQRRQIVIDDYFQSTTEWNRLLVFGSAFPRKKSLNFKLACFEGA